MAGALGLVVGAMQRLVHLLDRRFDGVEVAPADLGEVEKAGEILGLQRRYARRSSLYGRDSW